MAKTKKTQLRYRATAVGFGYTLDIVCKPQKGFEGTFRRELLEWCSGKGDSVAITSNELREVYATAHKKHKGCEPDRAPFNGYNKFFGDVLFNLRDTKVEHYAINVPALDRAIKTGMPIADVFVGFPDTFEFYEG